MLPFCKAGLYWFIMPTPRKSSRKAESLPQKVERKSATFRLPKDVLQKLKVGALRARLNRTVYLQLALQAQFEKDGLG
jgi:hypothetical protein